MIFDLSFEERVANGVEFLNENGPAEWWNRIDYDLLDLSDGDVCILGQVFAADADQTGSVSGFCFARKSFPSRLGLRGLFKSGFVASDDDEYPPLRDEWINAIENIRVEVNA